MNYLMGIGGVFLVQATISLAVIFAGTGNGSFVGLGAMLLALYGIPVTAVINYLLIRTQQTGPKRNNIIWLLVISSILPVLQLALLIAQKTLDL